MTAAAVVIPVHDEEMLLERCLRSVVRATEVARAARPALRTRVVVVLDACRDDSARIAAQWPVDRMRVDARSVGIARAAGVRLALTSLADVSPERVWLAHTDADSVVPANWLIHQLALMDEGVDAVLGTVRPDFADLTARHVAHWIDTHPRGRPPGNVHGANLGIRASAYLRAGGFPAAPEHEDVQLVERAEASGAVLRASGEAEVVTSGRFIGRTPGGYAAFVQHTHRALELAALGDHVLEQADGEHVA